MGKGELGKAMGRVGIGEGRDRKGMGEEGGEGDVWRWKEDRWK